MSILGQLETHQLQKQNCINDDVVQADVDIFTLANASHLVSQLTANAEAEDACSITHHIKDNLLLIYEFGIQLEYFFDDSHCELVLAFKDLFENSECKHEVNRFFFVLILRQVNISDVRGVQLAVGFRVRVPVAVLVLHFSPESFRHLQIIALISNLICTFLERNIEHCTLTHVFLFRMPEVCKSGAQVQVLIFVTFIKFCAHKCSLQLSQ